MAGLPRNKYDLLPYATTLSPQLSAAPLNLTQHRPSKREYIESSDAEDVPSSPPRKYRARKRRPWQDSSDIGNSSDVEDDAPRRMFEETVDMMRTKRVKTVAGAGDMPEDIRTASQASQENSTSKFHRILNVAIMDGLDSVDFSYLLYLLSSCSSFYFIANRVCRECGLAKLPPEIGELKHLVRSSALQHKAPLVPQLKLFLGTGNQLTSLPFELFTLSNLTVLSLCMTFECTRV
jgi:hypothetical protein